MENFNPEFHWQREQKIENRKKFLKIFLVLFFVFVITFLIKKTFFIPEKNVSLMSLNPDSSKVVMSINKFDSAIRKLNQNEILSYIKLFTKDDLRAKGVITKLNKEFLWMENSSNSQAVILKTSSATFLETDIFASEKKGELDLLNRKVGYSDFYFGDVNLFTKKEKIYFVKLNEYIFCISNNLDYLGEIISKYDALKKNKFKNNENVNYLDNSTVLNFEIKDFDLSKSESFVKNLSFLNNILSSNSGKIELNFLQNSIDVYISSNNFDKAKIAKQLSSYYFSDLFNNSFFYKNFENNISNFDELLSGYISQSINSNVSMLKELSGVKNLGIMMYKSGNFLINSNDFDSASIVFKKLLSVLKPSTRNIELPDGTSMSEYYANPNTVNLKEFNDGNFIWYYDDLPEKSDFEMVKCDENIFISNDKTKILNLCTNRDRSNMLFGKRSENVKEIVFVNPGNNFNFPVFGSVKQILGINFKEQDNRVLFFKLFY